MNHAACILVVAFLCLSSAFAADPFLRVDYEAFTVWLNCQEHAVFKFRYNAQRDSGNFPRFSAFRLDPTVPYECQPSSPNSFKTDTPGALTKNRAIRTVARRLRSRVNQMLGSGSPHYPYA